MALEQAEKYRREYLQGNSDKLITDTPNINQLIRRLWAMKVLSDSQREELEALPTDSARRSKLYFKLASGNVQNRRLVYNNLVVALIGTENFDAVEILTGKSQDELEEEGLIFIQPNEFTVEIVKELSTLRVQSMVRNGTDGGEASASGRNQPIQGASTTIAGASSTTSQATLNQQPSDFPLHGPRQLLRVGDILQEQPLMFKIWPMMVKELLGHDKHGLETADGRTMAKWISDTLEKWIGQTGDAATLDALIKCLKNQKCELSIANLNKNRDKIRDADK